MGLRWVKPTGTILKDWSPMKISSQHIMPFITTYISSRIPCLKMNKFSLKIIDSVWIKLEIKHKLNDGSKEQ